MQWREPDIDNFIGVPGVAVGDAGLHGQDHSRAASQRRQGGAPGGRGGRSNDDCVAQEPSHSGLG